MRIICVDDEPLILDMTVSMCREIPGADDVAGFSSAKEALQDLSERPADIALLDIDMPEMNGILLAAKVKELRPDTAVIFLTGFSEYAVDAFKLHASGYLMKPTTKEQIQAEIEYALSGKKQEPRKAHISVQTFGSFELCADGEAVVFSRSKAKELMAYLIDRQGSSVTRAEAFAVLWEDEFYDRAMQKQMDVIIRSLKQGLKDRGIGEILEIESGSMRVRKELVDCDLYRFLDGDMAAVNSYRGEYMSSYSWASLTEAYMDRIQQKHLG